MTKQLTNLVPYVYEKIKQLRDDELGKAWQVVVVFVLFCFLLLICLVIIFYTDVNFLCFVVNFVIVVFG